MCTPMVLDANGSGFMSGYGAGAVYLMNSGSIPVGAYTLDLIPVDGGARKKVWSASGASPWIRACTGK